MIRIFHISLSILCLIVSFLFPAHLFAAPPSVIESTSLSRAFSDASAEFDVPVEVLLAIGYAETRWMDHQGKPSQLNGYGVMHLAENPLNQSLNEASKQLNVNKEKLKVDMKQNIRGASAVLNQLAKQKNHGKVPKNLGDWYTTVASYSGLSSKLTQKLYADDVFNFMNSGVKRIVNQEEIVLKPTKVIPNRGEFEKVQDGNSYLTPEATPDYPNARWVAASSSNYKVANREYDGNSINYVVIHTTQGSYAGAISWFQNPSAGVSAHYVIRSSDGQVTQMVQNKDIAYHAGNWDYNVHSIGIEHEGYINDPAWYTDSMYRSSANLTRWLCNTYGIPKDRTHIISHAQVPGSTHTDPGPNWDWSYYMSLVNQTSNATEVIVDNETTGRFTASANWSTSNYSSQKYGASYRFANPVLASDPAWYKVNVPTSGSYDVYAWWPANTGYNSKVPYIIKSTSGFQTVYANQTNNGGKWNYLGTFDLSSGDYDAIGVSRWTETSGYVIADAVKIVKK